MWNVATKSLVSTCRGHTHHVFAVAAMPDGQRILSAGQGTLGFVRVWLLNGIFKDTFKVHTNIVLALVALPDNQHALSGSYDNTVKLFNVNDGAVLRTFSTGNLGESPGAAARRPPLRQRLVRLGEHRAHTAQIIEHGLAPF